MSGLDIGSYLYAGRHLKTDLAQADKQLASNGGNSLGNGQQSTRSESADLDSTSASPSARSVGSVARNKRTPKPQRHLATAKQRQAAVELFELLANAHRQQSTDVTNATPNTIQNITEVCSNLESLIGTRLARLVRPVLTEAVAVRQSGSENASIDVNHFVEMLETGIDSAKRRGRMPTQALFNARDISTSIAVRKQEVLRLHKSKNVGNSTGGDARYHKLYNSAQETQERIQQLREHKQAVESVRQVCVGAVFFTATFDSVFVYSVVHQEHLTFQPKSSVPPRKAAALLKAKRRKEQQSLERLEQHNSNVHESNLSARDKARVELARALQASHAAQLRQKQLLGPSPPRAASVDPTSSTPRRQARARLNEVLKRGSERTK